MIKSSLFKTRFRLAPLFTSLLFVIPIFLAAYYQLYLSAIIFMVATIFSLMYHYSGRLKYGSWDQIGTWMIIITNTVLLVQSKFNDPYAIATVVALPIAVYFYLHQTKNKSDNFYSSWHILSAFITSFSILAFVT